MSDEVLEFTMGDGDNDVGSKREKLKFEQGKSYRISVANWPAKDDGSFDWSKAPRFIRGYQAYADGVGYLLTDKEGTGFQFLGVTPKEKIATVAILWPTNSQGDVDTTRIKDNAECKVLPWIFSPDKYASLASMHKELGLNEFDIKVKCVDTKFQKLEFTPTKGNMLRMIAEKDTSRFKYLQNAIHNVASNLPSDIGRKTTPDEVRARLAKNGGGSAPTGGRASVSSEEVDNLVDSLL